MLQQAPDDGRPPFCELRLVIREQEKIIHITHIPRTPQGLLHPMIKRRQIEPVPKVGLFWIEPGGMVAARVR